jgi:hypothetical protein
MAGISQFLKTNLLPHFRPNVGNIINFLLIVLLFLLPWQTRLIYNSAYLNGEFWEYGSKSLYGTEMLLWLIIILFTFNFYRKKENIKKINVRLVYPVLCILILGICVFFSLDKNISFEFMFHFLEALCLGIVVATSTVPFKKIGFALWSGGVAQGILAMVQFLNQEVWANKWLGMADHVGSDLGAAVIETSTGRWLRAYGSFGWPNSLGIYLAMVWVLGFILYFIIHNKNYKALITGGQLIILSGLILSFSRGAWIAAGVGIIILLYCILAKKQGVNMVEFGSRSPLLYLQDCFKQFFYSLLVVILCLITLWPLFSARLNTTTRLESRSIGERVSQYAQVKNTIIAHSWFGVGPGVYTLYLHNLNPELPVWELQPIHSIFLLSVAEMGVLVFCFFILIFLYFLKSIWQKNPMFLSIVAVLLVAGLFDHWLWSMYTGQLLWWVGWAIALKQKESF